MSSINLMISFIISIVVTLQLIVFDVVTVGIRDKYNSFIMFSIQLNIDFFSFMTYRHEFTTKT